MENKKKRGRPERESYVRLNVNVSKTTKAMLTVLSKERGMTLGRLIEKMVEKELEL